MLEAIVLSMEVFRDKSDRDHDRLCWVLMMHNPIISRPFCRTRSVTGGEGADEIRIMGISTGFPSVFSLKWAVYESAKLENF
jgi:hypothetical protein